MYKNRPFSFQLIIIGGFVIFFYLFFALATQVYKDYQIQKHIENFEAKIADLSVLANRKPKDVQYFSSLEYKDRYAKENLNLLNPGEKLIVIPQEEHNVVKGPSAALARGKTPDAVLSLPNKNQWWEYFFGQTLSVKAPLQPQTPEPAKIIEEIQG